MLKTLVFWQNIISIHQLPYIKELAKSDSVKRIIYVAEKLLSENRVKLGWEISEESGLNNLELILGPSVVEIHAIFLDNPNAHHFFSGLRANPLVFQAFKISLDSEIKRHLIVEGPFLYTYPKYLHTIKTFILDYKFFKHIDKVFAIGHHAINWYPIFGFKKEQIISFCYVVKKSRIIEVKAIKGPLKIVFVGALVKRKGLSHLINTLSDFSEDYLLHIIGKGDQFNSINNQIAKLQLEDKIKLVGILTNNEIRNILENYDILILPSLHDGWGAVVNEALMSGLFTICSDKCGAKVLIRDNFNGKVFSSQRKSSLKDSLKYCFENLEEIRTRKIEIKSWSKCIEPKTIAQYFLSSLESPISQTPPWQ